MSINTLKNTYISFKKETKMITSDSSLLLEENRTFKKEKKRENNKCVCVAIVSLCLDLKSQTVSQDNFI